MSRILVTGKNGQLGKSIQKLIANTDQTDDFIFVGREELDLCNESMVASYFKGNLFDIIINCAAFTQVDKAEEEQKLANQINHVAVSQLAQIAKNQQIKLIHISTDEVYGDLKKGNKRADENFSYNPSSPYAASKASADLLIKSYIRTYKFPAIIVNCSNNYGPNQFPEKLIPKLIYNIINNKELPIYGRGKNSREWLHVKDHCMALLKIFEKGKIDEFYNIGSNKNLNNIQITKALLKIAKNFVPLGNNVKIKYITDRPGHDHRYALNSNKIKKKLNWRPQIKFDNGLKETFLWYLNNKKYYSSLTKKDIVKRLGLKK